MPSSSKDLLNALRQIKYPGFSRDIVSFGIVRDVQTGALGTVVTIAPPSGDPELLRKLEPEIRSALGGLVDPSTIELRTVEAPRTAAQTRAAEGHGPRGPKPIPGVAATIAVASGKGGVGKSTVAVNLALALKEHGRVGLLDADVYGPSDPLMLGVEGARPEVTPERRIVPLDAQGLRMVSMGSFLEEDRPVIWRGPMVTKLLNEFLQNVEWGELDFLVLDLPPGTGDVQLTLAQQLAMSGGLIVTTPQDVALADVQRGVRMFNQVGVPVLGVVENMSGYVCRHCGTETEIFGKGGGERMAESLGVPFLGRISLVARVAERADQGTPIVVADPDHPVAVEFRRLAAAVVREVRARQA